MNRKTVLVTGASRGIGKAIALEFAGNGYDTAITCVRRADELRQTQKEIESCGAACLPFVGDAGDPEDCERLFAQIKERFGRLDVLVNNAGISVVGLLQDMTPQEWDRILRTNLTSVFLCCRQAIPLMLAVHAGKIVNISSVWGNAGASCEVAYSATKGGIHAFTRALARELAPSGIQVNAVACGAMDTEMNAWLSPEELSALTDEIPAGRLGKPAEAAALVLQLCTGNDYLTGQIIALDGAWT